MSAGPNPHVAQTFAPIRAGAVPLLRGLMARAMDNLSDDDLARLVGRREDAAALARYLASLCLGLGGLLQQDSAAVAGEFQGAEEVSSLLFLVGTMAEQVDALLQLATDADGAAALRGGAAR